MYAEYNGLPSSGHRTSLGQEGSASSAKQSQAAAPVSLFHLNGRFLSKSRTSVAGSMGRRGSAGIEMSSDSWLRRCPTHRRWSRATNFFCLMRLKVRGLGWSRLYIRVAINTGLQNMQSRKLNIFRVTGCERQICQQRSREIEWQICLLLRQLLPSLCQPQLC